MFWSIYLLLSFNGNYGLWFFNYTLNWSLFSTPGDCVAPKCLYVCNPSINRNVKTTLCAFADGYNFWYICNSFTCKTIETLHSGSSPRKKTITVCVQKRLKVKHFYWAVMKMVTEVLLLRTRTLSLKLLKFLLSYINNHSAVSLLPTSLILFKPSSSPDFWICSAMG